MILENDFLQVHFTGCFLPAQYLWRPTGDFFEGTKPEEKLWVDEMPYALQDLVLEELEDGFLVTLPDGRQFSAIYELREKALFCELSEEFGKIDRMDFSGITLLCFHGEDRYFRDIYQREPWDAIQAKGLAWTRTEKGKTAWAWPQEQPEICVHACGFREAVGAFLHTDYAVEPLVTRLLSSKKYPKRAERFSIGINCLPFRLRGRELGKRSFQVIFTEDVNGDRSVDECDYQLALRAFLEPLGYSHQDIVSYKILCQNGEVRHTSFQQALDIIREVHRLTNGKKQIVYLTGWQYSGHDTGYPSFDKSNENLGTKAELIYLIETAKKKYGCTVSVHINLDDSYQEHPGWDPQVICRDTDGSLMQWEMFGGKQAYHISHTKDVESGKVFQRLEALFQLLPIEESIHIDAFRNTNLSWEKDGLIGPEEELYCGMIPILSYLRERGIDVTTEALNGMTIEPAGLFSGFYHKTAELPVLYHGMICGGLGQDPKAYILSSMMDRDVTYHSLQSGMLCHTIAMQELLSLYLNQRKLLEFRETEEGYMARYDGNVTARVYAERNQYEILCGEICIADEDTRFVPLSDGIYVYAEKGGNLRRQLPIKFQNCTLKMVALQVKEKSEFFIEGTEIVLSLPVEGFVRIEFEN